MHFSSSGGLQTGKVIGNDIEIGKWSADQIAAAESDDPMSYFGYAGYFTLPAGLG